MPVVALNWQATANHYILSNQWLNSMNSILILIYNQNVNKRRKVNKDYITSDLGAISLSDYHVPGGPSWPSD